MKITACQFERAAFGPQDEPRSIGPEVVFLGRSNVGKSSLINRLLGARGLAKTSARPGRTQSVNFFRINGSTYFVDLPGYGYARVPERVRRGWGPMVEGFLERRKQDIAIAVLIVDARHEPSPLDVMMRDWLEQRGIPYVVAATKTDKLSSGARARTLRVLERAFGSKTVEVIGVSSLRGTGMRGLWKRIDQNMAAMAAGKVRP